MHISYSAKACRCCVRKVLRSQLDNTSGNHDDTLHQLWTCHATDHAPAEDRDFTCGILGDVKEGVICLPLAAAETFIRTPSCHKAQRSPPLSPNYSPAIQHALVTRRRQGTLASSTGDYLFLRHRNTPRGRASYIVSLPGWHKSQRQGRYPADDTRLRNCTFLFVSSLPLGRAWSNILPSLLVVHTAQSTGVVIARFSRWTIALRI